MDGLLVVDKPAGPTSHDVVDRVRRALRERRVGHTGTLDPMATGVLPLVVGRATRLARFLSASDKTYEAAIHLGFATDSGDSSGRPLGEPFAGPLPAAGDIEEALDAFRGTFAQQPPAFSAKKIAGTRSYKLARQAARAGGVDEGSAQTGPPAAAVLPGPVEVTAHAIDIVSCAGHTVTLRVRCTAGFYVRSLAHDLGARLGVGAHLAALCRTSTGEITLADAIALAAIEDGEAGPGRARSALIPLARMLPGLPACRLTLEGLRRAACGRDLGPADFSGRVAVPAAREGLPGHVRLLGPDGALVALAEGARAPGLLHPVIVLM